MERDRHHDGLWTDEAAATGADGPASDASFRYAEPEAAMVAAEVVMDRYEDVLRELAK